MRASGILQRDAVIAFWKNEESHPRVVKEKNISLDWPIVFNFNSDDKFSNGYCLYSITCCRVHSSYAHVKIIYLFLITANDTDKSSGRGEEQHEEIEQEYHSARI